MVGKESADLLAEECAIAKTWESASAFSVSVRKREWQEVEALRSLMRRLRRENRDSELIREIANLIYVAVRALCCSPISPSSEYANRRPLIDACDAFMRDHSRDPVTLDLEEVKRLSLAIVAESSPVQKLVAKELSNFGLAADGPWKGQPEAVIIVPKPLLEGTREFVTDRQLAADVQTPSQAKNRHYRAAIICGDINLAYGNRAYESREKTRRINGWIVTAPPADEVILVETPASENEISELWLFSETASSESDCGWDDVSGPQSRFGSQSSQSDRWSGRSRYTSAYKREYNSFTSKRRR